MEDIPVSAKLRRAERRVRHVLLQLHEKQYGLRSPRSLTIPPVVFGRVTFYNGTYPVTPEGVGDDYGCDDKSHHDSPAEVTC